MRRRLIALILLMLLIGVVVAILRSGLPTARAALDARRQLADLEAMQLSRSQLPSVQQLTLLDQHLTQLNGDLATIGDNWGFWQGPALLCSRVDPSLHRELEQIGPLIAVGSRTGQAGHLLVRGLLPTVAALKSHPGLSGAPLLVRRLAEARPALQQASALLEQATQQRGRIAAQYLPAVVQHGLQLVDRVLPQAPADLRALAALPAALGADGPRDYLVAPQNNQDLRATGGYIGTVAILRADHGQFQLLHIEDSHAVDDKRPSNVLPPAPMEKHGFGFGAWSYHDANWSADFPTSAQLLEIFYRLGTGRRVDGAIAFDPALLQALFSLTGPVTVPGSGQTLTGTNAFQVIDYQVNAIGQSRKTFAAAAYLAVFARLLSVGHGAGPSLSTLFEDAVRSRDLLLYANSPALEQAIRTAHAGGGISPRAGDYLYVVDTDMNKYKDFQLLRESIAYRAAIQPDRSILATVTLHYASVPPPPHASFFLSDFVRVLVPEGSTLLSSTGLDERWGSAVVHGRQQFSGYFTMPAHATRTVVFRYRVPPGADIGARYTLLVQRQPGTAAIPLSVRVTGAGGARVGSGGVAVDTTLGQDVTIDAPLSGVTPGGATPAAAPEPVVAPGSHPELWVTVPSGSTGMRRPGS